MNERFREIFHRNADASASAPGRVNLIGEHTDYNGGYVLPVALTLQTDVQLARRAGNLVRAASVDMASSEPVEYRVGEEHTVDGWIDYLQGITWSLSKRGHALPGFDVLISSTVPIGKGLSSSASLEVAMCRGLRALQQLAIDDVEIATLSHRAETDFVGAPVGVMDPMVCSLGDPLTALFLDASTGAFEKIPLPPDIEVGVIDSGISHHHASGEYRTRRRECEEAARLLGVAQLRQLSADDLPRVVQLPEPLSRRARHVITENARVLEVAAAMRRGDSSALGPLFQLSHVSMREDLDISLPEIDELVSLANDHPRVIAARLTGGGFGGSIVALCQTGEAASAMSYIAERYRTATRLPARPLIP